MIVLSRRLNRPDGSFAGTVYSNIDLKTFTAMFSALNVGPQGTIALRDGELGVIARYPDSQGTGSTIGNKAASPQLLKMLQAGENAGTWHSHSAIDKVERVFSFHKISSYPLYVVVGRATSEYLSDWRKEALKMILLSALFIAAIAFFSSQILLRRKREEQAGEELRKLNTGLEEMITARTAEVWKVNEQLTTELAERKIAEEKLRLAVATATKEKAKTEAMIAAMGDAVSIQDTDYSILYQNQASMDIYGPHVGEYCYRAYQEMDHVCERCHLTMAFRDGRVHTLEQERATEKGLMHYEITASPVKDSGGIIIAGIELVRDITYRKRQEQALAESEKRYHALFDQSPDGALIVDMEGRIIEFNDAAHRQLGYTREEFAGLSVADIDPLESPEEVRDKMQWILKEKKADFAVKHCTKSGEIRDVHIFNQVITMAERSVVYSIWHDITERKQTEERIRTSLKEKEILLKEIHHRVKNNLQVVASMLRLQAKYIKDPDSRILFDESQSRVETMSLIHEKLYRSKDLLGINFREYVDDLVVNLLTLHSGKAESVSVKPEIEGIFLNVNSSIPCGLIINELVSNALKHAFPDSRKGDIAIVMHSDRTGNTSLSVRDNGVGFPQGLDFRNTDSLGMQLIISLVNQLGGTIELDSSAGSLFRIEFRT